jgi:hypothetical protein
MSGWKINFSRDVSLQHFVFVSQKIVWETLALLQHTSYTELPVVFENVTILQHLEIPERGMYVRCKYIESVIETRKL